METYLERLRIEEKQLGILLASGLRGIVYKKKLAELMEIRAEILKIQAKAMEKYEKRQKKL